MTGEPVRRSELEHSRGAGPSQPSTCRQVAPRRRVARPSHRIRWTSQRGRLTRRHGWLAVAGSVVAVTILLLSSLNLASLRLPSSGVTADSSPTGSPPLPFLPYVVDPSQFPLPSAILGTLGNVSNPQLTAVSNLNQTVFELLYTRSNPNGSNATVMYTAGRYDPGWAVCILSPSNCTGQPVPLSTINWSTPVTLLDHIGQELAAHMQTSIAASGSTVAVAISTGTSTNVSLAGSFGLNTGWTSLTPKAIPGVHPKLAIAPCALLLTTVKSNAVTATTFDLPCGLPQTPPLTGGGGGEHSPLGPGSSPPPFVVSVSPNYGQVGTPVTITGGNFAPSATVAFGSTAAWTVAYVSATQMTAVAPPGTGVVNVTVTVSGMTSGTVPDDQFNYIPPAPPAVESVVPSTALPDAFVNVTGANFDPAGYVYFGGRPALQTVYVSATDLEAKVPWGVGAVDVQVIDREMMSTVNPGDVFTFAVQAATLPAAISAAPVVVPDTAASAGTMEGIVSTQNANASTVFLRSTNGGSSYTGFLVGHYTTSTGSPLLSTLGSTRVFLGGGIPAETAALNVGSLVFALYTTQLENRTVVETSGSTDGGQSWMGPYPSAPLVGTLADPTLAASPNGYVYATWLENGAGSWQLDQAVFAESGQLLYGPTPIPGSASGSPSILASPAIAVDGLARPLYVWAAVNASTNLSELRFTGAFPSAGAVLTDLSTAFQQTESEPWDFTVQGGFLTTFENEVNANLTAVQSVLSGGKVCTIQSRVVHVLGPELSTNLLKPVIAGVSSPSYCGVAVPAAATDIVNATGPGAADTYLGVYLAWLAEAVGYAKVKEPYWPGAPGNPDANDTLPYNPGAPFYAPDEPANTTGQFYTFSVNPVTVNPNVLWLNVSGIAFGRSVTVVDTSCGKYGGGSGSITSTDNDNASAQWATVTVTQPSGGASFLLHGFWQSSYLDDLVPGVEGSWSMTVHTNYTETQTNESSCNGDYTSTTNPIPFTSGMPQQVSATLSGNFTTVEETVPGGLVVHEVGTKTHNGNAYDYVAWNNSIVGWSNTTVKGPSYSDSIESFANVTSENTGQFAIPLNRTYTAWANLTSEDGGWSNPSWTNKLNTSLNGGVASSPQTGGSSCSFVETPNPIKITWINNQRITDVTTSGATLTWYSNTPGRGWAMYNATDDGVYTQTALEIPNAPGHPANYSYEYTVQLNGLSPWNVYRVTVGVSAYSGCLEFDNGVAWNIQVLSLVEPQEMDYPYDSITQEGGGARVTWTVPSKFAATATFDNGTVTYCQWVSNSCATNSTVIVPLPSLSTLDGGSQFVFYWVNDTFQVNLTALTLNAEYNVTILLNYTVKGAPFVGQSDPYYFQYEKDTSGDGLTDWEKIHGWNVTWQRDGSYQSESVWANPNLYATNGLTNDFFEKEFGLNPWTISTTNDGMLDTWNLTFDLGAVNGNQPALPTTGFSYWYENSSYDFASACPDPELKPPCSFAPVPGGGNLTDNGPGSSEILWNSTGPQSALAHLQGLIAADHLTPLRAVTGSYGGDRTITVWGKLSWGADPLAYSTSHYQSSYGTDVPDGAMVDPLGYADLNVTINSWSMSGLSNGDGVAAFIHVSSSPTSYFPAGRVDYSTFSVNSSSPGSGDSCPADCASPFTVVANVPVESDEQFALLNFSMVAAKSAGYVWDNTSQVSVDLSDSSAHTVRLAGNNQTQNYTLNVSYQVAPVFSKATTILLVPGDNSTLSGLPLGLQRYTGEQNFILLELNDTVAGTGDTLASTAIPYVNSTAVNGVSPVTYTVGLTAGLNNLLIPRSLFKDSPLGEALLNVTFQNVTGHDFQGSLNGTFEPGYWIARDTGTVFDGINYSLNNSPGGGNDPSGYIKVYSNRNQNCTQGAECGGVPSNSAIEATVPSYAIGAIFALNVSTAADLNDLLAGLVLNESGNFTNWAFAATPYLPSLGLSAEVTSALANPVFFNSGGYGAPTYTPPPPSPPAWQQFGSAVWNAVSGIPLLGALISAAWNWVAAAASYVAYIVDELGTWGLKVLSQTVSVLKEVAGAIVWALDQILTAIVSAVKALFEAVTNLVTDAMNGFTTLLWSALHSVWSDFNSTGTVAQQDAVRFMDDLLGTPVLIALAIAAIVAVALVVVQVLAAGADFVVNILIQLLVSIAIAAAVAVTMSMVPATALSAVAVASTWALYNGTKGGSCPFFGVLESTFRVYHSVGLTNEVPEGVEAVGDLNEVATGFMALAVYPIVIAAVAAVSLSLAVAAHAIGGGMGKDLSVVGGIISTIGALYGLFVLVRFGSQLKAADQFNTVLAGELLSGLGIGLNFGNIGAGC